MVYNTHITCVSMHFNNLIMKNLLSIGKPLTEKEQKEIEGVQSGNPWWDVCMDRCACERGEAGEWIEDEDGHGVKTGNYSLILCPPA